MENGKEHLKAIRLHRKDIENLNDIKPVCWVMGFILLLMTPICGMELYKQYNLCQLTNLAEDWKLYEKYIGMTVILCTWIIAFFGAIIVSNVGIWRANRYIKIHQAAIDAA